MPDPQPHLEVIVDGYVRRDGEVARVAGTVTLVRAQDRIIVVDPGMVADQDLILAPLADRGIAPGDVTDVVVSHHHPDHTVNIGLFGSARVHDHWAVYHHDRWEDRPADGAVIAPGVELWETPGHTAQDISTIVRTADEVVVCTHLWWDEHAQSDPRGTDLDELHRQRARVLAIADRIVPGHGPAFRVTATTPR